MATINFNSNQTVTGSTSDDLIVGIEPGGNNNDIVYGLSGNDTITFKNALNNSTLYGGQGDDSIRFTSLDVVYGQIGNDTLLAHGSSDTIYGGDGNDFIHSENGASNIMYGGLGNDTIKSINDFADVLYGNLGHDFLYAYGSSNDTMYGGQGADRVRQFRSAAGVLYGNQGDDLVEDHFAPNNHGTSVLYGGQGDDTLVSHVAAGDTMYGGVGNDLFVENSLLGNSFTADDMITVGDFSESNDSISMSTKYGYGMSGFQLVKEDGSSVSNAAEALAFADDFYSGDNAHTFLFIYGGTDSGVAAGYLFYNSDHGTTPHAATDGMILLGDNAASDLQNDNIVSSLFASSGPAIP